MERGYDIIDYISMHQYYDNVDNDTPSFLANSVDLDQFITNVAAICDYVKGKKHSDKTVNISLDEWNVWYHSAEQDKKLKKWVQKPHQLEDIYNFEDALLVGSMLITILRHADRVKIACLAQLVNVIAPIMTSDTGAWRQTIFYPFFHASAYGRGTVLSTIVKSPTYECKKYGEVPCIDCVVVSNDEKNELVVFAVNKDLHEDIVMSMELKQFRGYKIAEHITLHHEDVKAVNTEKDPNQVVPKNDDNYFELKLSLEDAAIGRIAVDKNKTDSLQWTTYETEFSPTNGFYPIYLIYHGKDKIQLKTFKFA